MATKPNPFAGFAAKAKSGKPSGNPFAKFEKSKADKEPKGMKEGSKKEEALDKKQSKMPAFKCGGKAKK